MKRCIEFAAPGIALRCLVSASTGCGLVKMSTTIWSVGRYLSASVPCSSWSLVPLEADVFGLLADQGVLRASYGALVVLLHGGCSGDGFVEDLPHKLAKVESLLCGVRCRVDWATQVCCLVLLIWNRPRVNK
jgi:hypothetical protein